MRPGAIGELGSMPRSLRLREDGRGMKGGEVRIAMRVAGDMGVFMSVARRLEREGKRLDMVDVGEVSGCVVDVKRWMRCLDLR